MNYLRYVLIRILQTIPVLFGVSVVVFIIIHFAPGDPVVNMLGIQASQENIEKIREAYGLNEPLYVQYAHWVTDILHGNFGRSLTQGNRPVAQLILSRLPATLFLAVTSMVVAVVISLPAGIISAVKKGSRTDYSVTVSALTGISIPNFWLGLLLILLFARYLNWLPPGNFIDPSKAPLEALKHVLLPAITVGTAYAALLTRQTRSSVLDNLQKDNVRMAKSKGLNKRRVLLYHVVKHSLLPVITVAGLQFGYMLSATVVVEQVFAWPGLGRLIWLAVRQQDYPTVQGTVLVIATIFVMVNLLVDLAYSYLDPRVKAA